MAELGNKCTSPDAKSIVGQLSSAPACSSADLSGPLLGVSPARKSVCSHSYLREPTRAGNVLRFSGSSAPPDFSMLSTMHSGTPGTGTKLRCCSCVFPTPALAIPLTLTRLCRNQQTPLLIGDPVESVPPWARNSQDLGRGKSCSTSPIGLEDHLVGKFRRHDGSVPRDRTRTSPNTRRVVPPVVWAPKASSRRHP